MTDLKNETLYQKFISFIVMIFSKIPLPKKLKSLINYETVSYIFIGVLTTVISFAIYFSTYYFMMAFGIDERIVIVTAEVLSFVLSVLFSYFPNKIAVFDSHDFSFKKVIVEMLLFYASRIFSFLAETVILLVTITVLHLNDVAMKLIASVVVVILNYIFSKFFVFTKSKKNKEKTNG